MKRFPIFALLILTLTVFSLSACRKKVARLEVEKAVDLSGFFNDTDSRLVSEEMIQDALARPWVEQFTKARGRMPDVIIGRVVNKSQEHINTETFVKDLERALLNSGRVSFVAAKGEREGIREERDEMAVNAEPETRKAPGHETGADYMIIGQVNSILDTEGRRQVRFYQVELEAVDIVNNKKVWIGQKKIKKYITRAKMTM